MLSVPPAAPADTDHSLATFADCAELALILAADFDHAHVAALTRADGCVLDGVVLTEPDHTIDHCVGYALALLADAPTAVALTFITVTDRAERLAEPDLAAWGRMRAVVASGATCRDWLCTDGRVVRSLGVTTGHGSAWSP
jgi:hypothetical protein